MGRSVGPLDELIVEGLDTEQIWEQINLQMEDDDFKYMEEEEEEEKEELEEGEDDFDDDINLMNEYEDNDDIQEGFDGMYTNDQDEEDDEEEEEDEEDFGDASNIYYNDFFDPPESSVNKKKKTDDDELFNNFDEIDFDSEDAFNVEKYRDKKVGFEDDNEIVEEEDNEMNEEDSEEIDEEEEESENSEIEINQTGKDLLEEKDENLSKFELEQKKLREKIMKLEEEAIAPKSWGLLGESTGNKRPENSLLEEVVDFEHATKVPKVITRETTITLEEIIKKRIIEGAFDDVIRRVEKPDKGDWRPRLAELDHEKSVKALSEIYEEEYMKQTQGVKDIDKLTEQHEEASKLFKNICLKLDALSNAHFTPLKTK